ncbi:MAG TPA: chemotaxis protein CheA [Vicinamibacterales bacterium]|nr:chemotaxis protein CheA [Vicinamibacterales bacterium]
MSDETPFAAGFMDEYFAECDEHLAAMRRLLLDLESSAASHEPVRPAVLEELFRSFHSIKGISGMVELREAETLAHHMESYLRGLRQRDARLTDEGLDALVAGVDLLERIIAARRDNEPAPASERVIGMLAATAPDTVTAPGVPAAAPPDSRPLWRVTFAPSAALLARGINVDSVRARLRDRGEIRTASPRIMSGGIAFEFLLAADLDADTVARWQEDGIEAAPVVEDAAEPAPAAEPSPREAQRVGPSHVVRVDLTRLDDLMRIIGDLVISRARLDAALDRIAARVPPVEWRVVQEHAQTLDRHLRDMREGVTRLRLVPIGEIFRRMPFVVRDLARDSGRRVRLELHGQETEIDKFLIERMMDPVLHLVRNAVSHGFEPPGQRLAAGKPEEGTLTLSAASVGHTVVLEIADDGRGIDAAAVAARAQALGLEVPAGPLDPRTLLDLICAPGFSTRDETDRASGRGVGMAVVKSTVEELNGTLSLQTAPGEGTRFVIELPLTLSIADAFIAHVGERTFAVPQGNVREIVEVDPASIRAVERHEIVPFRGGSLPLVRLSRLFGLAERPRRALHAFVVGSGQDAVGIAVDRVSGQREIVVRGMSDAMVQADGVAGATDLGDGRVVLILNLPDLARHARARAARTAEPGGR